MSEFASEKERVETLLRQRISENIRLKAYAKSANYHLLYEVSVEEAVKMIVDITKERNQYRDDFDSLIIKHRIGR